MRIGSYAPAHEKKKQTCLRAFVILYVLNTKLELQINVNHTLDFHRLEPIISHIDILTIFSPLIILNSENNQPELEIKETNNTASSVSFLDLLL